MLREKVLTTRKCRLYKVMRVLPVDSYFHSDHNRGKILRKAEKFSRDVFHVARDSVARRKHSKRLRKSTLEHNLLVTTKSIVNEKRRGGSV